MGKAEGEGEGGAREGKPGRWKLTSQVRETATTSGPDFPIISGLQLPRAVSLRASLLLHFIFSPSHFRRGFAWLV